MLYKSSFGCAPIGLKDQPQKSMSEAAIFRCLDDFYGDLRPNYSSNRNTLKRHSIECSEEYQCAKYQESVNETDWVIEIELAAFTPLWHFGHLQRNACPDRVEPKRNKKEHFKSYRSVYKNIKNDLVLPGWSTSWIAAAMRQAASSTSSSSGLIRCRCRK